MTQKRGQITVFIIIGIVVLVVVGLVFLIRSKGTEEMAGASEEAQEAGTGISPIKLFVQNCLEETAKDAFYTMGYQGGHFFLDDSALDLGNYRTAYAYYEGESRFITLDQMKKETEAYLRLYLSNCLNNFESFPDYQITGSLAEVNIQFTDEKTLLGINYPLEIRSGDSVSTVSDFSAELNLRMSHIHEVADTLIQKSISVAPYLVDLDYIRNLDMNVTAVSYKNNTIIYAIKDPLSKVKEDSYAFVFASKVEPAYNISTDKVGIRIKDGLLYADFLQ